MTNYTVNELTRQVGAIVRGLMARYSVTQSQMAESIGVSQSQLSKQLRGTRPIDIDQLDAMATSFGGSAYEILQEAEEIVINRNIDSAANLIFVVDGIRLSEPIDTRTAAGVDDVSSDGETVHSRDEVALAAFDQPDWQARQEREHE